MKEMMRSLRIFRMALLLILSAPILQAQTMPSLMIGTDAVTLAKGSVGIVSMSDGAALQNNVALMSFSRNRFSARVGGVLWQPSYADFKTFGAGGTARVTDRLALGLDFRYLVMPSYDSVSESGTVLRDGSFTPGEMNLAVGGSYAFLDCLSAGLTLRYAASSLAEEAKASIFGLDVGFCYRKDALAAGISVNNIGTKVKYGEGASASQPSVLRAGAGYRFIFGTSALEASAEADLLFAGGFMGGIGCEYSFKDMLFVRAGYHFGTSANAIASHASAGLGVRFFGLDLSLACLFANPVLSATTALSLAYSF